MSDPYIGEIRTTALTTVPVGWALCNGQLLNIGPASEGQTDGSHETRERGLPNDRVADGLAGRAGLPSGPR